MQTAAKEIPKTEPPDSASAPPLASSPAEPPFGVNEVCLNGRQWLLALSIVLAFWLAVPALWKRFEPFPTGPDYRIPYSLSKDYWLYQRRLEQVCADPQRVPILGDSVVWGEYVRPDGALSHFLNQQSGQADGFLNCGVNGLFPLALEGLVQDFGGALRERKVIVHCNVLWMTSPKADLSADKVENFNHSRLVPQFTVRVPSYGADASERLSATIERHVAFFAWTGHLQNAYYGQRSIPQWTLEEDGSDPPTYPNAWRSPLAPLASRIPGEPADDPQRGPSSRRHKPWTKDGGQPTHFEWVDLDASIQWQAFRRVIALLRGRGNDVLVVLGPFNEHMIAPDQRSTYHVLRDGIVTWLTQNGVPFVVPETLPSELYADASHPLTEGYARLAERVGQSQSFQQWRVGKKP